MKESPFVRVDGSAEPERIREVQEMYGNEFHRQEMANFPPNLAQAIRETEIPKSQEQIDSIDLANKFTNEYLASLGLSTHDVPSNNFHILPRPVYRALSGGVPSEGLSSTRQQATFLDNEMFRDAPLSFFASTALHEMIEFKGPATFWVSGPANPDEKNLGITQRQAGMRVFGTKRDSGSKGEAYVRMDGLDEAIVVDIQKLVFGRMFMNRLFKKERDEASRPQEKRNRERMAERDGIPAGEVCRAWEKDGYLRAYRFPYYQPRLVLSYMVNEIFKSHEEQFKTLGEVRKKFHKARFTLDRIETGRLIHDTFGESGLRTIAAMTAAADPNPSAAQTLEKLKSLRA